MTDNDLLNKAIDILIHNGLSSVDLHFIRKYKHEILADDIPDEERNLYGVIKSTKQGIKHIMLYSKTSQGFWNLRALWVNPDHRNKKIATTLLAEFRRKCRGAENVAVFIPFNEQRFALSKLLLKNGYRHNRYITSISATEFNSIW